MGRGLGTKKGAIMLRPFQLLSPRSPANGVKEDRQECLSYLIDVVLLPVEGGVGLDDDVFVRVLLEFVDEHGLARL